MNKQEAQECASQLLPEGASLEERVRETPSGRFAVCISAKLIEPSEFKQPNAEALVQAIRAERGESELTCAKDHESKAI